MVTVGSILQGTIAFIRQNPRTLAVWALINLLINAAMRLMMQPIYAAQAAQLAGAPAVAPPVGSFLLFMLAMIVAMLILNAAIFRAVLTPEQSGLAYLRLGMDELRLLGTFAVLTICFYIAMLVVMIALILLAVVLSTAFGVSRQGSGAIAILLMIPILLASIFFVVRFSLAGPLTLLRGKVIIGQSWALTRGHFWRLFGAYFAIWLTVMLLSVLMYLPVGGQYLALMSHMSDPGAQQQIAAIQAQQMSLSLTPFSILTLLASVIVGTVAFAAVGGSIAVATRQLLDERAGLGLI